MKEINSSSERISKIIQVTGEIAFQTNILALNAAVAAARSANAVMGFPLVADAVPKGARERERIAASVGQVQGLPQRSAGIEKMLAHAQRRVPIVPSLALVVSPAESTGLAALEESLRMASHRQQPAPSAISNKQTPLA